jgi:glycine hydroxymethyltransferase
MSRAPDQGITGSKLEKACDLCHITLNKNAVVGDVSAMTPGGVRIGSPAMTSRGLREADFEKIADLLHEVLLVCKDLQATHGKLLKDFTRCAAVPGLLLEALVFLANEQKVVKSKGG